MLPSTSTKISDNSY